MNQEHRGFIEQYLFTLTDEEQNNVPQLMAEHFCADEYNANECARLIDEGIKRASCSLKAAYEIENEALPQVGQLAVVLNWAQEPVCIVKLIDVSICPFNKVTREFSELEGEGDGTYEWWREAHVRFFTDHAKEMGFEFTDDSEVVLERFEKVYPLWSGEGGD